MIARGAGCSGGRGGIAEKADREVWREGRWEARPCARWRTGRASKCTGRFHEQPNRRVPKVPRVPNVPRAAFSRSSKVLRSAYMPGITLVCCNRPRRSQFDGPGYRVQLPTGITGITEARVDFDITTFRRADGSVLVGAYAGLHPSFVERGSRAEKINGLNAKRFERTNSEYKKFSEGLVTIRGSRQSRFQSVHFSYLPGRRY